MFNPGYSCYVSEVLYVRLERRERHFYDLWDDFRKTSVLAVE